ncbi:MAG TPA: carbon-nitrogen family hydrolase [Pyrinomonadaceae bacterium]|nr:carbon-nitrogen family hydrolase [Pyrinomonadaceae bacterium]
MCALKVAAAQLEITLGQPESNIAGARRLLAEAKQQGAELVLLPELWTTGYDLERTADHAVNLTSDPDNAIAKLAREFGVYLGGSVLEKSDGKFFNSFTIYSPAGELLAVYRKLHLFAPLREPVFLSAGDEPVTIELPWGKTSLAICYDLRFPELFRSYALNGTRLMLVCAEWPHPRLEHWRTLLRARAIENQAYVVACNAVGRANDTVFFGHSMIINPWGEVLAESGESETTLFAELDLAQVDQIRAQFPVFADRREELFSHKKAQKAQKFN